MLHTSGSRTSATSRGSLPLPTRAHPRCTCSTSSRISSGTRRSVAPAYALPPTPPGLGLRHLQPPDPPLVLAPPPAHRSAGSLPHGILPYCHRKLGGPILGSGYPEAPLPLYPLDHVRHVSGNRGCRSARPRGSIAWCTDIRFPPIRPTGISICTSVPASTFFPVELGVDLPHLSADLLLLPGPALADPLLRVAAHLLFSGAPPARSTVHQ